MMIPTQPEDSHELDPIMWAVWQLNVDEIHIERIVADKETAERVASSLNLLRRTQTGCFSGRASGLAASVQEQGRLLGQGQLAALIAELGVDVQELRGAVDNLSPRGKSATMSPFPHLTERGAEEVRERFAAIVKEWQERATDCAKPSPECFPDSPAPGPETGLAESYQSARHKPWWEVTHKGV